MHQQQSGGRFWFNVLANQGRVSCVRHFFTSLGYNGVPTETYGVVQEVSAEKRLFGIGFGFIVFNGISTFVGYSMSKLYF